MQEGADPKVFKPFDLAIHVVGYNHHVGINRMYGLILTWNASVANTHHGARLPELISKQSTG